MSQTSVGLFDDASGIAARKRVVTVQSHEVAHQWFGNIVTMSWWQELWLNEAFATLMGSGHDFFFFFLLFSEVVEHELTIFFKFYFTYLYVI